MILVVSIVGQFAYSFAYKRNRVDKTNQNVVAISVVIYITKTKTRERRSYR